MTGLRALGYEEEADFSVCYDKILGDVRESTVVQIDCRLRKGTPSTMRQRIQYVDPNSPIPSGVDLLIVDEAAAIPIPRVSSLIGPYVVVLASTLTGYEGTGRALQLKLMNRLRTQLGGDGAMLELTLATPVRYAEGDAIEAWLHRTLCLDSPNRSLPLLSSLPPPDQCALYHVDRDALFSYHPVAESILQHIMTLYTAAHYKNSPNDLQILCDAPAHRLFVLLGPRVSGASPAQGVAANEASIGVASATTDFPAMPTIDVRGHAVLPDVLVVMQVSFEGGFDSETVVSRMSSSQTTAGDLIPWTLTQQFCSLEFARLCGARIVRIAARSDIQGMGYGTRAMKLFTEYITCKSGNAVACETSCANGDRVDTTHLFSRCGHPQSAPRILPPLLVPLAQIVPPRLDWVGVSFGLTPQLLKFWDRGGFEVVYVRQSRNQTTGEYTVIVLRAIGEPSCDDVQLPHWLVNMVSDARCRFARLIPSCFKTMDPFMCLQVLGHARPERSSQHTESEQVGGRFVLEDCVESHMGSNLLDEADGVRFLLTTRDMERLNRFGSGLTDYRSIADIAPIVADLFFCRKVSGMVLPTLQAVSLLSVGLQRRDVSMLANELRITRSQALALYGKTLRKVSSYLKELVDRARESNEQTSSRIEALAEDRNMHNRS